MTTGVAVELREVTSADVEVFFQHQLEPEATAMAACPARDLEAHRAHWAKVLARDDGITRAVVADGAVAGNIVSWVQDGHREIGYWIGMDHWGRGIATEAVRRFVALVRERPLFAVVVEHNVGSIRVLEKVGFRRTGEPAGEPPDGVREVHLELDA